MISPYSRSPGLTNLSAGSCLARPAPRQATPPGKEKGPGSAFGPESSPSATSSVSVVYWVPGPFPRPTPVQPDEPVGPANEPVAGLCSNIPPTAAMSIAHLDLRRRMNPGVHRPEDSRAVRSGPSVVICRFYPDQGRIIVGRRRKFASRCLLQAAVSGYGSPHLAVVISPPCSPRGRRRAPPPEVMRMDDSADRFLELIHQLEDFTHSISPDQAHSEFDETTLQLFWMRWPQLSAWAGSLWRRLSEELAGPSAPHDSELFEIGESG